MKKLILVLALISSALIQNSFAQQDHAAHQAQSTSLLPLYYSVKEALVSGDATLAASKSGELAKAVKEADAKAITNRDTLLEHAGKIAESKDLKSQRMHFAGLSTDMIALAKTSKLSAEPIYQQYCPMKKSNWLSSEKAIKNPYYGSSMLTCGQVVETIK
jgi:hypothetical protein